MEFQKSSKNDYYRYITNGLSELIGKNSKIRNEIYAISESQSKLIPELLFNLVEYSFLYECTFYDLDSIIINNKEFNSFGYYHVLFAPPLLVEPEIIDEITDIFDNPIRIEMVIGLTNEEFLSYEKNGGEFLIESLKKDISSLALDKKRVL